MTSTIPIERVVEALVDEGHDRNDVRSEISLLMDSGSSAGQRDDTATLTSDDVHLLRKRLEERSVMSVVVHPDGKFELMGPWPHGDRQPVAPAASQGADPGSVSVQEWLSERGLRLTQGEWTSTDAWEKGRLRTHDVETVPPADD